MLAVSEGYEGRSDGKAWALKQAMLTIESSARTRETESADPLEQGRVAWLRRLGADGRPLVAKVACPLSSVPRSLEGKDWTRYEGVLHTDHAVREEFFSDRDIAPTTWKPYLMDFTYLYDQGQDDFREFTGGERVSAQRVFEEIGRPEIGLPEERPGPSTHRGRGQGRRRSN